MPRVSGDVLDTGDTLYLSSEAIPGVVRTVTVAQVKHGLIWLGRFDEHGAHGDRLVLECRRPDDAVYRTEGKVEFVPPESWALRRVGEWERIQRREHLRVAVWHRVDAELTHAADGTGIASFSMLDLSIGGARLATQGVAAAELTRGTPICCRFTLRDAGEFDLRAEVVRSEPPEAPGKLGCAAIRFLHLDINTEASLARWVQQEQMRRGR
jgi:hypothetical protein